MEQCDSIARNVELGLGVSAATRVCSSLLCAPMNRLLPDRLYEREYVNCPITASFQALDYVMMQPSFFPLWYAAIFSLTHIHPHTLTRPNIQQTHLDCDYYYDYYYY